MKTVKPSIKGSIMVLIGILNSRQGIGIEIFTNNLILGPIAYFFLSLCGLIVIRIIQNLNNSSKNSQLPVKQLKVLAGVTFFIGFIITIIDLVNAIIIYYFNILIIVFIAFIGILWSFLGLYATMKKDFNSVANITITTLTFSIGLIYGALLNTVIIPLYVLYFFLTISFLQASRELVKGFNKKERDFSFILINKIEERNKILKFSFLLQILSILFLIFPIFTEISYLKLYFFLLVIFISIIGLASFLTLKSILKNEIFERLSALLKMGILIEFIIFFLLGT